MKRALTYPELVAEANQALHVKCLVKPDRMEPPQSGGGGQEGGSSSAPPSRKDKLTIKKELNFS